MRPLVIQAGHFSWPLNPREIWDGREILRALIRREFQVRYRQTALGLAWVCLQPILAMAIFTVVLGTWMASSMGQVPYSAFVLAGMVPWTYFSNTLIHGSTSLVDNVQLVTRIYIPRGFFPFAIVTSKGIDLFIGAIVLIVWSFFKGAASPEITWLWFVPILTILILLATGTCLLISALCVRFRDIRYVVPFLLQIWFFATPIVYSSEHLSEGSRLLLAMNPLTGIIEGLRAVVFGSKMNFSALGLSAVQAFLFYVIGAVYFRITERRFADVI